ncbi:hypothetical protein ACFLIM_18875 [Nonomuraea sp. M3C6]|uniref:Uncharacterized protein n=1 Tax=Nonomuraea marmarensis TaxID=3351344 RepID=A0ABW7AG03_9ACTN
MTMRSSYGGSIPTAAALAAAVVALARVAFEGVGGLLTLGARASFERDARKVMEAARG